MSPAVTIIKFRSQCWFFSELQTLDFWRCGNVGVSAPAAGHGGAGLTLVASCCSAWWCPFDFSCLIFIFSKRQMLEMLKPQPRSHYLLEGHKRLSSEGVFTENRREDGKSVLSVITFVHKCPSWNICIQDFFPIWFSLLVFCFKTSKIMRGLRHGL